MPRGGMALRDRSTRAPARRTPAPRPDPPWCPPHARLMPGRLAHQVAPATGSGQPRRRHGRSHHAHPRHPSLAVSQARLHAFSACWVSVWTSRALAHRRGPVRSPARLTDVWRSGSRARVFRRPVRSLVRKRRRPAPAAKTSVPFIISRDVWHPNCSAARRNLQVATVLQDSVAVTNSTVSPVNLDPDRHHRGHVGMRRCDQRRVRGGRGCPCRDRCRRLGDGEQAG